MTKAIPNIVGPSCQELLLSTPSPMSSRKDVVKHLPAMRALGLDAAADYLFAWSHGHTPLEPFARCFGDACLHYSPLYSAKVLGALKNKCFFLRSVRITFLQWTEDWRSQPAGFELGATSWPTWALRQAIG